LDDAAPPERGASRAFGAWRRHARAAEAEIGARVRIGRRVPPIAQIVRKTNKIA
jgi:hypothetical protein